MRFERQVKHRRAERDRARHWNAHIETLPRRRAMRRVAIDPNDVWTKNRLIATISGAVVRYHNRAT
jgi:hypothetical protein